MPQHNRYAARHTHHDAIYSASLLQLKFGGKCQERGVNPVKVKLVKHFKLSQQLPFPDLEHLGCVGLSKSTSMLPWSTMTPSYLAPMLHARDGKLPEQVHCNCGQSPEHGATGGYLGASWRAGRLGATNWSLQVANSMELASYRRVA